MVNGFYLNCNNCSDADFSPGVWHCAVPSVSSCTLTGARPSDSFLESVEQDIDGQQQLHNLTELDLIGGGYICSCDGGLEVSSTTLVFWLANLAMIAVTVIAEIMMMGLAALYASCLMAVKVYEFKLTPMNETRAFVAASFIRATFELGNPNSAVLGVDPVAKSNLQQKIETSVLSLVYMLKVVVLGLLIKLTLWAPFVPLK